MDKEFIMKLDDEKDLLEKKPAVQKLEFHPIPFPAHRSFLVKKNEAIQLIREHTQDYQDREFIITCDNYGIEVSINYEDGEFRSMILKGTGEQGERVNDDIALRLMPKEAKNKKKITLHALLTIIDPDHFRDGVHKHDVPRILKQALLSGLNRYEDKSIVCRPYALFIDGVRGDVDFVWEEINSMVISGIGFDCNYDTLAGKAAAEINDKSYLVPRRGIIISDLKPEEEKALPTTHYLFDDDDGTIA